MKFSLPFLSHNPYFFYNVKGKNNKVVIVEENGTERELGRYERIDGLKIVIKGNNNLIKINSTACLKGGASFLIRVDNCQIRIKEHVNLTNFKINFLGKASNSNVEVGRNFITGGMEVAFYQGNSSLIIGDDCIASSKIIFWIGDGHEILQEGKVINDDPVKVEIGKHSWIGYNCTFLKNAKCAENTIIAAGSVVSKKFDKENVIIAGNPAGIIKENVTWEK